MDVRSKMEDTLTFEVALAIVSRRERVSALGEFVGPLLVRRAKLSPKYARELAEVRQTSCGSLSKVKGLIFSGSSGLWFEGRRRLPAQSFPGCN